MMRYAFNSATGEVPQLLWSPGETMAAFRSNVSVKCLSRLTKMDRVHAWMAVERFAVLGATEHGPCKLLIYNQHQPASDERPFPASMRIAFCKAIISDAIRFRFTSDSAVPEPLASETAQTHPPQ